MFGISWAELFVILLVAVLVVPARLWPDVARFLARVVNFVRRAMWKITDATENIKQQIELDNLNIRENNVFGFNKGNFDKLF